ncbi:MAG: hypothetical protein ABI068_10060 [Ktedonobacterales bacterium]
MDRKAWAQAEQVAPKYPGPYILDYCRPIGRVYRPDGTVEELPQLVADLTQGKKTIFDFPEIGREFVFTPNGAETLCVAREFGYGASATECTLPSTGAISTMRGFAEGLAQRMVTGSYLTQEQADKYLAPITTA